MKADRDHNLLPVKDERVRAYARFLAGLILRDLPATPAAARPSTAHVESKDAGTRENPTTDSSATEMKK